MKLERSVFSGIGFYDKSWLYPEGFESSNLFMCYWVDSTCTGYMNQIYNNEKHYFI